MKIKSILLFDNLNVAVFDSAGEQIPELQKSFPALLAEHMERLGYDPSGCVIETQSSGNWRLIRNEDGGWNRERA